MTTLTDLNKVQYSGRFLHGESGNTPEYVTWQLMKRRAERSNGRISVCPRWLDSYAYFLVDMGRRPTGERTLDRIDTTLCLAEWAERLQISYFVLRSRLSRGWDVERAFTQEVIIRG